jgi:hypothetical protein
MNFLEQIAELDKSINKLDTLSGELQKKAWGLREKRNKLIAEMILEENLLGQTTWTISMSGGGVYLSFNGAPQKGTAMDTIAELARTDYHCDFTLQDGITLRFDDNDTSLVFKESKTMLPFITKHGLIINGSSIQDALSKLKREVASLEATCHQFKL